MAVHSYRDGKWRIRFMSGGQRVQRVVTGTKQEALEMEARLRLLLKKRSGQQREPESRPAKTFFEFCRDHYKVHCLDPDVMGWRTYNRKTKYHLKAWIEHLGATPLDSVTTAQVQSFKHLFRKVKGRKASYVNGLLDTFNGVLKHARFLDLPVASPKVVKLKEDDVVEKDVWTEEELLTILETTKAVRPAIFPLLLFLVNTGARKGEALALRWQDVDTVNKEIHFRVRKDWSPKNGKARVIGINDALLPWLEERLPRKSQYVFNSQNGSRWGYFPQKQLDTVLADAGLSGSPHKFRHSWTTHFVLRTRDLFLTARLLGHSHAYVTERYAHLLPEHLQRAREALSIGIPEDSPGELVVLEGGKASEA